jgi:hypothetical protein
MEWRTGYVPNHSFDHLNGSGASGFVPAGTAAMGNGLLNSKHSPLGMELGEFILDGDLNFLSSRLFEYNNPGGGMV